MLRSAEAQYQRQASVAAVAASGVKRQWSRVGVFGDWDSAVPQMAAVLDEARAIAVNVALPYTGAALAEQGMSAPAVGELNSSRFLVTAPSGAPVRSVLESPVITARAAVGRGIPMVTAFEQAASTLVGIALTMMADTRRGVYGADIISRPKVSGYIRMLQGPSCARCVVLAGRFYRWSSGFQRHPRCDCQHVPTSKAGSRDLIETPTSYFEGLTAEQQDKVFGRSNARAIRDGADISRVVNVQQRGLSTAIGRSRNRRFATMTVDDIYRVAGTRTNAIRLLTEQGYLR